MPDQKRVVKVSTVGELARLIEEAFDYVQVLIEITPEDVKKLSQIQETVYFELLLNKDDLEGAKLGENGWSIFITIDPDNPAA
jgi:hypothetical protein